VAGDYDSLLDTRESTEPVDALIPGVLTGKAISDFSRLVPCVKLTMDAVTSAQTGGSITITNLTTLITSHGGAEMYLELVWQNGDKNFSRPFTVVDLKDLDTTRKNPIYSSSVPYGSDLTGGSDGGDGGNDGSGNGNGVITQNPLSGSNLPATEAMPISTASTTSGSATSLGALTTTTASTSTSVGIVIATGLPVATSSATAPNSGLSTGAKAGIAVAAAITGLALLAGLVFLFLRRRRRHSTLSHDPAYFENQHNPGLMAQKEATVGTVDVTPTSPYFDHGGSRISIQQPIMTQTRGGDGDRGSSQVHDQGGETGGDARPGSATAGSLTGRVTPHGAVSHLVEDGMTEEEIRRLEEEERELDQAIEQAGAGRRG
jgi:LPXTG-motif cell wall-anchored protein